MSMDVRGLYDWWPLTNIEEIQQEADLDEAVGRVAIWPVVAKRRWIVISRRRDVRGRVVGESRVELPPEIIQEMTDEDGRIFTFYKGETREVQVQRFVDTVNDAAAAIAARTLLARVAQDYRKDAET